MLFYDIVRLFCFTMACRDMALHPCLCFAASFSCGPIWFDDDTLILSKQKINVNKTALLCDLLFQIAKQVAVATVHRTVSLYRSTFKFCLERKKQTFTT